MKPKLHLNFSYGESFLLDDIKLNLIHSKAFKYLMNYNQSNTRDYFRYLRDTDTEHVELTDMREEYVKVVEARGYSQGEYQTFTFNFKKEIENDSKAIEELTYLDDLQYYFTASEFFIEGYIEEKRTIKGKVWTNREDIEYVSISKNNGTLDENDIDYFLSERGLNRDSYELVYNLDNINY